MTTDDVPIYHSLFLYEPTRYPREAICTGVLVYFPPTQTCLFTQADHSRLVRQRYPGISFDDEQLSLAVKSLARRLDVEPIRSLDQLRRFAATRANCMQVSQPCSTGIRPYGMLDPAKTLSAALELHESLWIGRVFQYAAVWRCGDFTVDA